MKALFCLLASMPLLAAERGEDRVVDRVTLDATCWKEGDAVTFRPSNRTEDGVSFLRFDIARTNENVRWPGCRLTLPKPVDVTDDCFVRMKLRMSAHHPAGPFVRLAAVEKDGAKRYSPHLRTMGHLRQEAWPLGVWCESRMPCGFTLTNVSEIVFGLNIDHAKVTPPGFTGTVDIAAFEIVRSAPPPKAIRSARQAWEDFRASYRPDYSDGSKYLRPTEGHRFAKSFPVVRDGKPACRIRYAKIGFWSERLSNATTELAARELQRLFKMVTGVEIPIDLYGNDPKWRNLPSICLGKGVFRNDWKKRQAFREDLRALGTSDGYAIREIGGDLYVCGVREKGVLNGVFALVENNTDIIFTRPDIALGTVFTPQTNGVFSLVWGQNVLEKPKMDVRAFWDVQNFEYWNANYGTESYPPWTDRPPYTRGGHNVNLFAGGHAGTFSEKSTFETNPEFYGQVNGIRDRVYGNQLCFTNPRLRATFVSNVVEYVRFCVPDAIRGVSFSLDDSLRWCECAECRKPIRLEDGTVVDETDPSFTSTRYFLFLNEVAAALDRAFPGKRISTLAYFQTADPPKCRVRPNVSVKFCAYPGHNEATPMFMPENYEWFDRLLGWRKKIAPGQGFHIYGYNGLGYEFPRPNAHVQQFDWRFYAKLTDGIEAEGGPTQDRDGIDRDGKPTSTSRIMDFSAIEFWMMMRLMWNPDQDVEQLYKKFCYRTYREAAPEMERFFGTIREIWFAKPIESGLGDGGKKVMERFIIPSGRAGELRGYLEKALSKVRHPTARKLIERLKVRFEEQFQAAMAISLVGTETTGSTFGYEPVVAFPTNGTAGLVDWRVTDKGVEGHVVRPTNAILVRVRFERNERGRKLLGEATAMHTVKDFRITRWYPELKARRSPRWFSEGVVYQIVPRLFTREGTLKAAKEHLKWVRDLGVATVYLTPTAVSDDCRDPKTMSERQRKLGNGNPFNPYRIMDYEHVDPEYGTDQDLKDFIAEAHRLGLRVLNDVVYMHAGPSWKLARAHPEWLKRDRDGKVMLSTWQWPLPDFTREDVQTYFIGNMVMWVRDFGFDGFRCDVADGAPLHFWERARAALEAVRPDVALIAESQQVDDYLYAFDTNYGWPVCMVGIIRTLQGECKPWEIRWRHEKTRELYLPGSKLFYFTENHDTANDSCTNRAETVYGHANQAAGLVLVLTMDAVPLLYMGQEFASSHNANMFAFHSGIDWKTATETPEAKERLALVRKLMALRAAHPALRRGELVWLDNEDRDRLVTFERRDAATGDRVRVRVNLSKDPAGGLPPWGWTVDALTGER